MQVKDIGIITKTFLDSHLEVWIWTNVFTYVSYG